MRALETAESLERFQRRGAGTDAERRAARWLAGELESTGREVLIEQFWCRPNWPLAHAWHIALAVAGSLTMVSSPRVGGALLLAALVFVLADELTGHSPGRWLTRQRASQNVVARPRRDSHSSEENLRLVITANYDAGRAGLAFRDPARRAAAAIRNQTKGLTLGWLGWVSVAVIWLLIVAIIRLEGHNSTGIGLTQLPPTIGLVLGLALLLDLATAEVSPAGGDNGSGVGVAVELARALDAAPPRHLDVEVVLTGAGDIEGRGLRHYLRRRKATIRPTDTAVLGVAACTAGSPCWWRREGRLVPLRSAPRMQELAARVAQEEPNLGVARQSGGSNTPAHPARLARIPAMGIGTIAADGLLPRSHQRTDTADAIESAAVEQAVEFGLMLVDAIDASLAERRRAAAPTPA